MKKQTTYINKRNIRFKEEIGKLDKKRILGVGIDPSKTFHRAVIFDFTGKLLTKPLSIDTFKDGYEQLKKTITKCSKKIKAQEVYIAIEGAASYSENIIRHLRNDFQHVVFMATNAVAANRQQRSLQGLKTDDVDAGAVGDLLIRGEFKDSLVEGGVYYRLRELIHWRQNKTKYLIAARNQITSRLERIYPGLNVKRGKYKRLFATEEHIVFNGLLKLRLTGQELLKIPTNVLKKQLGYRRSGGIKTVEQLKQKLGQMLLPYEEIAREQLKVLERDVKFLNYLKDEINEVETEIIELAKETPARYLSQMRGVSELQAAIYVGLVGDVRRFKSASEIYAMSGLCPKIQQSGLKKKTHLGIRRTGSKYLRVHLFRMAGSAALQNSVFREYYLKKKSEKHWKKARIAVANKLNRVLFALLRDKAPYKDAKAEPLESSNVRIGLTSPARRLNNSQVVK